MVAIILDDETKKTDAANNTLSLTILPTFLYYHYIEEKEKRKEINAINMLISLQPSHPLSHWGHR